jgi:hypothetical protein
MKYILSGLSLLVGLLIAYGLLFSPTFGQGISNLVTLEPDLPLVAGRPFAQAQAVVDRHRQNLEKVPGVYFVTPGNKVLIPGQKAKKSGIFVGVRIHTNAQGEKPTTFPPEIQAIPTEIEGFPVFIEPVYILPPPPGVTILKPGGGREQGGSCPAEYEETESRGWRFCVHREHPEPIPAIMAPPIAGIPYETAMEIMERHRQELMALPGVGAVGMSANGISIEADDPTVLPAHVEGVPLDVRPRPKENPVTNAHTITSQVRPVRGGIFAAANYRITLTGIGFSCGMWVIFPAHALAAACSGASSCTEPVERCTNRYATTNTLLFQPENPIAANKIGQVVRWTALNPGGTTLDVAAAWADNDVNQGNCSLSVNREIDGLGSWTGEEEPLPSESPRMFSGWDPHAGNYMLLDSVNVSRPDVRLITCSGQPTSNYRNQLTYTAFSRPIRTGDSGAPIITSGKKLNAMHQWSFPDGSYGGGVLAFYIRQELGISKWYGTAKFPNHPQVCQ